MLPKIEEWKKEFDEITNDLIDIVENQFIFHRIGEIIQTNPKINQDNLFWDHLRANYSAAMVVGITRQIDEDRRVISFMRLLKDIERNVTVITKTWFADQYQKNLSRQIGEAHFAKNFSSGEALDPAIVKKDIDDLATITTGIEKYRHTRIAHKIKDPTLRTSLTFKELDDAIDHLAKLITKYQLLLNQAGMPNLMPVIQYDWEAILRTPWIKS
jgi:hypothetical protein